MAVGTIATSVLTDIANAIRYQAGVATTYLPREMAAAVAALDGTNAGNYVAQPYKALQSGIVSEHVFSDIADAIREQNGGSDAYTSAQMAPAILALSWDTGLKVRALLLTNGTLEFSYRDGGACPLGTVAQRFEVSAAGYTTESARPWHFVRSQVTSVVFDSTFANAGMTNLAHFCSGFSNMTEVVGFQHCAGVTDVKQMFTSCGMLETIWATGFDNSTITSYSSFLYGCHRLVGGADGYVPSTTSGKTVLKTGAGGVLTVPGSDIREWFKTYIYDDGTCVCTVNGSPDANKTLLVSGRVCATAKYTGLSFQPWQDHRGVMTSVTFAADMATLSLTNMNYWFYSCSALTSIVGLANLANVSQMRYAFTSCIGLVTLDFRGFNPSGLTDLFYTFSGCNALMTIYASSTWALPTSGISGMQCFYNCRALVGGNGTTWSSSNTSYTYMQIDAAGSAGYLTAA